MSGLSEQMRGHLVMLLFSAVVAGSFSLGALVANDIEPAALNAVRFLIAAILLGTIVWFGPGFKRAHFKAPWRYLVLGGLFGFYFVMMFEGLKTAAPVSASTVFTLIPLMSAGFGYVLLRQVTTRRMATAISIAGVGALWVIFRGDLAALAAFDIGRGEVIYFLGCIGHAIYIPMVRRLNRGENPVVFSFGTLVAGLILISVVGFRDVVATDWTGLSPLVWLTILYTAILASALSFVLVQYATLRLPAAKVMAYSYLTPSWVILWQVALGNPWPTPIIVLGVGATVVALIILLKDEVGG